MNNDSNNNLSGENKFILNGSQSNSNNTNNTNNVNTTIDASTVFGVNLNQTQPEQQIQQNMTNPQMTQQPNIINQPANPQIVQQPNLVDQPVNPQIVQQPNLIDQPVNPQMSQQPTMNINKLVDTPQQNEPAIDDEELLKEFIGENYEKITTKPFNFAGFFFTSLYMCYRKLFGYAIIAFILNLILLNVVKILAIEIAFNIIIGFIINKLYVATAKKKVAIIKYKNPNASFDELKTLCAKKGGTSGGQLCLGIITHLFIAIIFLAIMIILGIGGFIINLLPLDDLKFIPNNSSKNGAQLENVTVSGYACMTNCTVSIKDSNGNIEDYIFSINDSEIISLISNYEEYINLNISYNKKGNEKTVTNYKITLKSNNEDISNIKTESELREKIGLYTIGTHTDTLTLSEIGTQGAGYSDDNGAYMYRTYTFLDSNNNKYKMNYINDSGNLNLIEGQTYTVVFEVEDGTFGYEFIIKSIN